MDQSFLDVLKRHAAAGQPPAPDQLSEALDAACLRLANLLGACDSALRQDLLALIPPRILALLGRKDALEVPPANGKNGAPSPEPMPGPPPMKLTPELLEWARRQFSEEEIVAGLREVRETGGLELRDFIHELEQASGLDERALP